LIFKFNNLNHIDFSCNLFEYSNNHLSIDISKLIGFEISIALVSGQRAISENGYAIIRDAEGFRSTAYLDTGGVWTIGFGTIKYPINTQMENQLKKGMFARKLKLRNG
jgi:hypothetical protein